MRARTSSTPDDARRVTMQVSTVGIVCNAALTVFKLVAGIVAHSSAIVADAVHSASDILGDQVVRILDPSVFLKVLETKRSVRDQRTYLAEYKKKNTGIAV